ncbi:hypothetical protein AB1Y20_000208 [Prymnesium parvum]|uniref:BRCA2 OB1 domain-containing protein n=1 Tax=Prymnesium parvum TaxID=97485 RepID=A0AB34K9S9_PRYPA
MRARFPRGAAPELLPLDTRFQVKPPVAETMPRPLPPTVDPSIRPVQSPAAFEMIGDSPQHTGPAAVASSAPNVTLPEATTSLPHSQAPSVPQDSCASSSPSPHPWQRDSATALGQKAAALAESCPPSPHPTLPRTLPEAPPLPSSAEAPCSSHASASTLVPIAPHRVPLLRRRLTLAQLAASPPHPRQLWAEAQASASPIYRVTSTNALDFAFPAGEGVPPLGWEAQWEELKRSEAGAPHATAGWVRNHYRWIVWKLACQARCFARALDPRGFSAHAVHRQLRHRYEREFLRAERPVLRKICEGDEVAACHMVLCVAAVAAAHGAVELTDGWYSVWAKCDAPLQRQLARGRLTVGLKLRLCGTSRLGSLEHVPPWELEHSAEKPLLQLHANGTRRAQWHCRMGRCRERGFRVSLDSLQPGGGQAPIVKAMVARVYGPRVSLPRPDGKRAFVSLPHLEVLRAEAEEKEARRVEQAHSAVEGREGEGGSEESADDVVDDGLGMKAVLAEGALTWRLLLVDAAHAHSPAAPPRCQLGVLTRWGGVGDESDPPTERGEGTLLGVEVPEDKWQQQLGLGWGLQRVVSLRKGAWVPHDDRPRIALAAVAPPQPNALSPHHPAAPCGGDAFGRAVVPLGALHELQVGEEFDTVGTLVLWMDSVLTPHDGEAWCEHEERDLYLTDESSQLLCVRWTRFKAEPLPQLLLGFPLVLLNATYKGSTAFASPPGCEALLGAPTWRVHMAEANSVGKHFAIVTARATAGAAHAKLQLAALRDKADALRERNSLLGALAIELCEGRILPAAHSTPPPRPPPHASAGRAPPLASATAPAPAKHPLVCSHPSESPHVLPRFTSRPEGLADFLLQSVRSSACGVSGHDIIDSAVMNFCALPSAVTRLIEELEGECSIYKDATGMYRSL